MNTKQGARCRLCFTIGFFHLNLFSTTQNAIEAIREIFHCEVKSRKRLASNTNWFHFLHNIVLQVEESDSLPNHICVDCWMIIKKFHEFYRNAIFAQRKFLLDGKITIKDETVPEEAIVVVNDINCFDDCKWRAILFE